MRGESLEQAYDPLAHQRFTTGDADLAHPARHERRAQAIHFLDREHIGMLEEPHVGRHAIGAAQIAAVGDRQSQIGHLPAEAVNEWALDRKAWWRNPDHH